MSAAPAIRQPGFPRLWLGQSVSLLGSQVTLVALPLTAVLTLRADPGEMGLLRTASSVPFLLFGLVAGAWVDRRSRLSVLTFSSVGQAVLLALIPALALSHGLRIELLYALAFLIGILTVLFDVAFQAFTPLLVRSESLVDANSKLETSRSMAQVIGPTVGGVLVQLVTAPLAILADALSFVLLAAVLRTIRDPETPPVAAERTSLVREVAEGLRALLGQPVLRAIAISTTLVNLTISIMAPILLLYLARTLHLTPTLIGVLLMVAGLGGVLGALAGAAAARWLSVPLVIGLGLVLCGVGCLLIAAATGPPLLVMAMLVAGMGAWGFGVPFSNVNQLSLRQSLTPARLQARVHASSRTLTWGAIPIGALIGGQLGEHVGLRPTLAISGLGTLAAALTAYVGVMIATRHRRAA
jgi:predicted MFS family arabinose efflux permease